MSRTYHCNLCDRDWEYEHRDCDKGASRMESLEARIEALEAIVEAHTAAIATAMKLATMRGTNEQKEAG